MEGGQGGLRNTDALENVIIIYIQYNTYTVLKYITPKRVFADIL